MFLNKTWASENAIVVRRFREFMKGSAAKYAGSMAAVVVSVLTAFLAPLLIAGAVDAVTDALNGVAGPVNLPWPLAGWFDERGGAEFLAHHIWIVAALLVAVSLLGGLFQYLRGKWSAEASETIAERMRTRLYAHLQAMDYDYHVKAQTGDLIQRCTTDVETVRRFLASQVTEIFRTVIMVVIAYKQATAHGAQIPFVPMLLKSLIISLIVGYVLIFILMPFFLKLLMGKAGITPGGPAERPAGSEEQ